jgi:hypothetical protein
MVLTDAATGWTECLPLVARSGALVIEALAAAMTLFPFPLRGVDFDNDGLFMKWPTNRGPVMSTSQNLGITVVTPASGPATTASVAMPAAPRPSFLPFQRIEPRRLGREREKSSF